MGKRKIVISDLHLGAGSEEKLEDFFCDQQFSQFLSEVPGGQPTELIINGDFIDFPQLLPIHRPENADLRSPHKRVSTTEPQSLHRLERAIAGHELYFKALSEWLAAPVNSLILIPGNHDVDLYWPEVRNTIAKRLGQSFTDLGPNNEGRSRLSFANRSYYQDEGTYIEHGNRLDPYNAFAADLIAGQLPILVDGEPRLERCIGTLFMDEVINRLEEEFPFVDGLYPETAALRWLLKHHRDRVPPGMAAEFGVFLLKHPRSGIKREIQEVLEAPKKSVPRKARALSLLQDKQVMGELGDVYKDYSADPVFRRELQRLVDGLEEAEWRAVDQSLSKRGGRLIFAKGVQLPGTLEAVTGKSVWQREAEELIRSRAVQRVVFGHTHDELEAPVEGGLLANSGTWTWRYDIAHNDENIVRLDQFREKRRERFPYIEIGETMRLRYFSPQG